MTPTRVLPALPFLLALAVCARPPTAHAADGERQGSAAAGACATADPLNETEVRGRYVNKAYGFEVTIPSGLCAWKDAAPNPDHGVVVALGPGHVVRALASYDAAFYGSTAAIVDVLLQWRKASDGSARAVRSPTELDGAPAEEAIIDRPGSRQVVVVQRVSEEEPGIYFELWLESSPASAEEDARVFDTVRRSFKRVSRDD